MIKNNRMKNNIKLFFTNPYKLFKKVPNYFSNKKYLHDLKKLIKILNKAPKKVVPKKVEPLEFCRINIKKNKDFEFNIFKREVKNIINGFSTLLITDDSKTLLKNRPYISLILNDSFISFNNKTLYFALENLECNSLFINKSEMSKLFLTNNTLRNNEFIDFRNIISINTLSPTSFILRQTNPWIKNILVIDENTSLNYISQYDNSLIDVVLIYEPLKENIKKNTFSNVPKVLYFNNAVSFLNTLKMILVDNQIKKSTENVLLPIISTNDNLTNIDYYNDNNFQALIRLSYNSDLNDCSTFYELFNKCKIEELFLVDDVYSQYKDIIAKCETNSDYINLIKKTLYDGIKYEEI